MFLVTGGHDLGYYNYILSTTEIFDPDIGHWRARQALPDPMRNMRATNIDNKVLIFGILVFLPLPLLR